MDLSNTFLDAPAIQPKVDVRFDIVAKGTRASLQTAMRYLIELPTFSTEKQKAVWMWHTSLTTIAWDVSDLALSASLDSASLRGARALNRMLLEYAARVHLYIVDPDLAEIHINEAANMLRRVMKPVAADDSSDPGLAEVRELMKSGSTKAKQPSTREMLAAMVATFIPDESKREPYLEFLDAEYALGNGYVHGSQSSFFDIFDAKENLLHQRTRVLHRKAEVIRCINCMLALLVGLEKYYAKDFGVAEHLLALKGLGPYEALTSIGTHDTLMALLGIQ